MNADPRPSELRAALRRMVIATVAMFVVLVALGAFVWVESTVQKDDIRRVAIRTNTALCLLRADLVQRVADSKQFLVKHPSGIAGISPADIQRSIDGQQQTIDALSILDCEGATA